MFKGLNKSNQTLRSIVVFKWEKIKIAYLRRYKGQPSKVGRVVDSIDWKT